jgi:SpoVK/Ycf46/Vps4 family AAA+-type ATPase
MLAQEMSNHENRGKIVWVLATSRPDLMEVDLKRPGRIDCKIPLFPSTSAEEGFKLLRGIGRRHGIEIPDSAFARLEKDLPDLLTPGEAENLLLDVRRALAIKAEDPVEAMKRRFEGYLPMVPENVMLEQIELAVRECNRPEYIPERFRK